MRFREWREAALMGSCEGERIPQREAETGVCAGLRKTDRELTSRVISRIPRIFLEELRQNLEFLSRSNPECC